MLQGLLLLPSRLGWTNEIKLSDYNSKLVLDRWTCLIPLTIQMIL